MEKAQRKIIKDFIDSDLDESEFFGVSKDNSITLEEYHEIMDDHDYRFQKMAQFEVESIKEKCPWVKEVWFQSMQYKKTGEFFLSNIHLFTIDNEEISVHRDNKTNVYSNEVEFPFFCLFNKAVKLYLERSQELYKIQRELKEIESIGKEIYNNKLHDKLSVSDNFKAIYRPDGGLYLFTANHSELVTAFLKPSVKNYDKPITKENDARALKKILLKK